MGHGFDVAPAQVQNWAVTEVLPPEGLGLLCVGQLSQGK